MTSLTTRRTFIATAPLAAAALKLAAQQPAATPPVSAQKPGFQFLPADDFAEDLKQLHAKPGNATLYENASLPLTAVLTVEENKSAKEFEWHEGRDHIVQILEGTTVYEVGGKPVGAHSTKPGEWNAPSAEGATKLTLVKGDMLVIPRNTLHKRSTAASVTFVLISTTGVTPK